MYVYECVAIGLSLYIYISSWLSPYVFSTISLSVYLSISLSIYLSNYHSLSFSSLLLECYIPVSLPPSSLLHSTKSSSFITFPPPPPPPLVIPTFLWYLSCCHSLFISIILFSRGYAPFILGRRSFRVARRPGSHAELISRIGHDVDPAKEKKKKPARHFLIYSLAWHVSLPSK